MQTCRTCEIEKPISEFRFRPEKNWRVKDCKPCESKAAKVWYKAAKKRDPIKWRIQVLRLNRSKQITIDWVESELDKQHHKCALSGRPIDILTLEVDHIVPRSKGGSDELSNLRLVCRAANAAKGELTDDELLLLCQEIIGRAIIASMEPTK